MKTIIKITIIIILVLPQFLQAQISCQDEYHEQLISGDIYYPYFLNYRGTPFYTNDWLTGSVKISSDETYNNLKIKYDIFKDDILYFNDSIKTWILIDKEIIKEVLLYDKNTNNQHVLVPGNFADTVNNYNYYFSLLNGEIPLFMKAIKTQNESRGTNPQENKLGDFIEKTKYYFVLDNKLYMLPHRKRKLLGYFPEQATALKKFISKNRYSLKNQDDLVTIFEEINRLY